MVKNEKESKVKEKSVNNNNNKQNKFKLKDYRIKAFNILNKALKTCKLFVC
jgi:hypothetical protein